MKKLFGMKFLLPIMALLLLLGSGFGIAHALTVHTLPPTRLFTSQATTIPGVSRSAPYLAIIGNGVHAEDGRIRAVDVTIYNADIEHPHKCGIYVVVEGEAHSEGKWEGELSPGESTVTVKLERPVPIKGLKCVESKLEQEGSPGASQPYLSLSRSRLIYEAEYVVGVEVTVCNSDTHVRSHYGTIGVEVIGREVRPGIGMWQGELPSGESTQRVDISPRVLAEGLMGVEVRLREANLSIIGYNLNYERDYIVSVDVTVYNSDPRNPDKGEIYVKVVGDETGEGRERFEFRPGESTVEVKLERPVHVKGSKSVEVQLMELWR
jgi:hypothetical protein